MRKSVLRRILRLLLINGVLGVSLLLSGCIGIPDLPGPLGIPGL